MYSTPPACLLTGAAKARTDKMAGINNSGAIVNLIMVAKTGGANEEDKRRVLVLEPKFSLLYT